MKFPHYLPRAVSELWNLLVTSDAEGTEVFDVTATGWSEEQWECFRRLVTEDQMKEVYGLLGSICASDSDWHCFLRAAVSARADYGQARADYRRLQTLGPEVSEAAERLAGLLAELRSIWLRGHMGDSPTVGVLVKDRFQDPWPPNVIKPFSGLLADLVEQSKTIGTSGPAPPPQVEAAIKSRKANDKIAYLRAFAVLISPTFQRTPALVKAVAITATVALDDPDIAVEDDEARKELRRAADSPGGTD